MRSHPLNLKRLPCDFGCGLLACLSCREVASNAMAREVHRCLRTHESVALYTLIPLEGVIDLDGLNDFDLKLFARRNRDRIKRFTPPGTIFAGAVDVCLNVFDNEPLNWGFHIHGVMSPALTEYQKRRLRLGFPTNNDLGVHKATRQDPIVVEELFDTSRYTMKHSFLKRSGFIADSTSDRDSYRSSAKQSLSPAWDEKLHTAQLHYEVFDPVILVGLRRMRTSSPTKLRLTRIRE